MQRDNRARTFSEIGRQVVRRWKTGIVAALITILASMGLWLAVGTQYTATAVLTVSPLTTNPFSTAAVNQQINIATERAILGSGEVARTAAESLGENVSAATLAQSANVEAPQGSQILSVTVSDHDPERAARHANALAKAYLDFRAKGASDVAETYISAIDKRIADLDSAAKSGSADSIVLADLINQRNDLALVAENPGRIIGVADGSATSSSPGRMVFIAAGIAGGLIVGLAAAMLKERLSRKVGYADRLAESTGCAVLRLENLDDADGYRWILKSLGIERWRQHSANSIGIGVMSLGRDPESEFRRELLNFTRSQDIACHGENLAQIPLEAIDRGWPSAEQLQDASNGKLLFVGVPRSLDGARIASLCERFFSAMVLVVDASVKLSRVDEVLAAMTDLPKTAITLIFVEEPRTRRKQRHAAWNRETSRGTTFSGQSLVPVRHEVTSEGYSK